MGGETKVEQWKIDFYKPTPIAAVVWGWSQVVLWLCINTYLVYSLAAESKDMSWMAFLMLNSIVIAYCWVMVNHIFPVLPSLNGIPFVLIAFLTAALPIAYPFVNTDVGALLSTKMPFWQLALFASNRLSVESSVQIHHKLGVPGISYWLQWPIQKVQEKYTLTYFNTFSITRTRGGNPDAFSSFFLGWTVAAISYYVNNDALKWVIALNSLYHLEQLIALLVGPLLHIPGGMPDPNFLSTKGTSVNERNTHTDGFFRGVLGVVMLYLGNYAAVTHLLFLRKLVPW